MKTILVIEDDDDTLQIIGVILGEIGYNIVKSLGLKSITYIKGLNPDLILLDHRLKDGSGKELCIKLKSDDLTKHIPVIFLSADINIVQITIDSCADAYITKPFDLDDLINTVNNFLNKA